MPKIKNVETKKTESQKCRRQKMPKIKNAENQKCRIFYFRRRTRKSCLKIFDFFFLNKIILKLS